MTKLLTEAFRKASQLADNLQDQIAQELLDEIQWESRWDETLAKSQDKVDRLSEKAAKEYKAGKTREMGFDEL
jgi:nitrate reductase beta subunit